MPGRKQNVIPTESMTVTTTGRLRRYLDRLVRTGLYGATESAAVDRLLARAIEDLIAQGKLPPLPAHSDGE